MSEESENVKHCPYCDQPMRNPEAEDLGKKYFLGVDEDAAIVV